MENILTVSQAVLRLQQILTNHRKRSCGPRGLFMKKGTEGNPYQSSSSLSSTLSMQPTLRGLWGVAVLPLHFKCKSGSHSFPTPIIMLFKMTPCSSDSPLLKMFLFELVLISAWPWFKYPGHANRMPKIPLIYVSSVDGCIAGISVHF